MSYIRPLSEYTYVDGENSGDYIFWSCSIGDNPEYIEDYGKCSDNTLVDLFAKILYNQEDYDTEDLYYNYLIDKLAKRLKVKLK